MITEDYIGFEIAKLLKEKGFNEKCVKVYLYNGKCTWAQNFMEGESFVSNKDIELVAYYDGWDVITQGEYAYLCPTLQMACKWLRELYNMHIIVFRYDNSAFPYIWYIFGHNEEKPQKANSYEEACETAIKYVLENLI